MEFLDAPPLPFYFSADHEQFRASLRDFVAREITPIVNAWDEAETFPRSLYARAAELGVLGLGYPEEYGGTPADLFYQLVVAEEFARCGCGRRAGVAELARHRAAADPGRRQRRAEAPRHPAGARGARRSPRWPSPSHRGGSDVARLQHHRDPRRRPLRRERREDLHHLGRARRLHHDRRAHRPGQPGRGGISAAGDRRRHAGPHAHAAQEDGLVEFRHRAPALRRLPRAGRQPRRARRTAASRSSCTTSTTSGCSCRRWPAAMPRCASRRRVDWARQRTICGTPLSERQVVRHKLMDMTLRIDAARALVYDLAWRIEHQLADPAQLVARMCLAKVQATQAMQFCADQAVQLLGGMGYMRGTQSERIYREVKVMMIGGGSEEVMKDLAARQLGFETRQEDMASIESTISPASESFQANRDGMLALLERVRGYEQRSVGDLGQVARALREARPAAAARARSSLLLDPGTPFLEIASLAGLGLDNPDLDKSVPGGGVIGGIGWVSGVRVHGQRLRLRHRRRRAAADGPRQAAAHAGARAREQAALRAAGRKRRRQPDDLQGRGVRARRQPVPQPRAHVGRRPAGDHGDARLVHRRRRLPDRPVGLHRDGARPLAGLSRRAAAAEGRHRRDRDRGRAGRRR